ncbi:fimbria/pilus periplasmic chaperone [Achromobacter xylosoxidans]
MHSPGLRPAGQPAAAAGVVPESSVLIVDEATGEGTMIVQNTDAAPVLLYTTIENVAEDPEEMVVATPPMARLEAGQSQLVRFMLTKKGLWPRNDSSAWPSKASRSRVAPTTRCRPPFARTSP